MECGEVANPWKHRLGFSCPVVPQQRGLQFARLNYKRANSAPPLPPWCALLPPAGRRLPRRTCMHPCSLGCASRCNSLLVHKRFCQRRRDGPSYRTAAAAAPPPPPPPPPVPPAAPRAAGPAAETAAAASAAGPQAGQRQSWCVPSGISNNCAELRAALLPEAPWKPLSRQLWPMPCPLLLHYALPALRCAPPPSCSLIPTSKLCAAHSRWGVWACTLANSRLCVCCPPLRARAATLCACHQAPTATFGCRSSPRRASSKVDAPIWANLACSRASRGGFRPGEQRRVPTAYMHCHAVAARAEVGTSAGRDAQTSADDDLSAVLFFEFVQAGACFC